MSMRSSSLCSVDRRRFHEGSTMELLAKEFESLGYHVDRSYSTQGIVVLKAYRIAVGSHAGKMIDVGVPAQDFPFTPPAGIHVSPNLVANGTNNIGPSPLGGSWQYWSRRLTDWTTNRSAKHIVSYINKVLADA